MDLFAVQKVTGRAGRGMFGRFESPTPSLFSHHREEKGKGTILQGWEEEIGDSLTCDAP